MSDCDEKDPCVCAGPRTTFCDRDRTNNVWVECPDPLTGEGGVCLLDNLTENQLDWILERDERARADLKRVTSDTWLLNKAETVPRLSTVEEMDSIQTSMGRQKDTIPFYSAFAGKPPFAQ
jgi:hypothetical protein